MRHITLFILLLAIPACLFSQQTMTLSEHTLINEKSSWLTSGNAAGLGLYQIPVHGISELSYNSVSGSYHRAQEGSSLAGLNFYTERFDKLGKNILVWGSFNFVMDREKERAWSDVINTYDSSPYIFGSSVPGSYDRQMFEFKVKAATIQKGAFTYGLGVDYKVGDLSRLRDPRTRVYLADYAVLPAITVRIAPKHVLGLNLSARFQKEKMPNITTVQTDPNLVYYSFYGLENADATVTGFKAFQRQFVSNYYGGELQYSLMGLRQTLLAYAGLCLQNQDIVELNKQTPGNYKSMTYKAGMRYTSANDNYLWRASLTSTAQLGAANENLQELQSVNDTVTGVNSQNYVTIFTYTNRYINRTYHVEADIKLHKTTSEGKDYRWNAGLKVGYNSFLHRYSLPFSEMVVNRMNVGLNGQFRMFKHTANSLFLGASVEQSFSFDNSLQMNSLATTAPETGATTYETGTYHVANSVVIPDYNYYTQRTTGGSIEAIYNQVFNVKNTKMTGYMKAGYHYTSSASANEWSGYSVTIGIIPM